MSQARVNQFELLPNVIHKYLIARHHDNKSLVAMRTASKNLYGFYKHEDRKRLIKKLFEHAINATAKDIQEIKRILDAPLKSKPRNLDYLRELLCVTAIVKDTKGRVHKDRTLYQIFLGARDYDVVSKNGVRVIDGSAEMLAKDYFSQLPDGEQLRVEQYYGQFPKGFEEKEKLRAANESRELNKVMKVITTISDADCQQTLALDSFHGYDLRRADWGDNEREVLASAIYLSRAAAGLSCEYIGLDGKVKNKHIAWDQLPPCESLIDNIIKNKYQYGSAILNQLAEPGEFYTAEQIEQLKVLSNKIVSAAEEDFENAWVELQDYLKNIVVPSGNFLLLKTLYQFRNFLESKEVYTIGYHSNPELLLEAGDLYNKNFVSFGNSYSSPKNVFCAQKIVGLAQRDLTACELQLWAQGPLKVLLFGDKSKRSFLFNYGWGSIVPLDSDRLFRLGYNYIAANDGRQSGQGSWRLMHDVIPRSLISNKNSSAAKIMPQPGKESNRRCTIM